MCTVRNFWFGISIKKLEQWCSTFTSWWKWIVLRVEVCMGNKKQTACNQFFLLVFLNGPTLNAVQKHISSKISVTSKIYLVNYCFPSSSKIKSQEHLVFLPFQWFCFHCGIWGTPDILLFCLAKMCRSDYNPGGYIMKRMEAYSASFRPKETKYCVWWNRFLHHVSPTGTVNWGICCGGQW